MTPRGDNILLEGDTKDGKWSKTLRQTLNYFTGKKKQYRMKFPH